MNRTALVIILAIVLIGGIMFYAFNTTNENGEDLDIGLEGNQGTDVDDNEEQDNEDIEKDKEVDNNEDKGQQTPESLVDIGQVAPNFTLKNLNGEEVSLEDYRGKNVIVNFWASWCPPCRQEMPDFQDFYEDYKDDDFTILAVNVQESKATASKFIEENGYSFPVLLDSTGEIAITYMVSGIPTSYILDKEGVIRYMRVGPLSYPEMEQIIKGLQDN